MNTRLTIVVFLFSLHSGFSQNWEGLNKQGLANYNSGKYAEAEIFYEQALQEAMTSHGKVSEEYITSVNNYAFLFKETGRLAQSLAYFQQASSLSEEISGNDGVLYLQAESQVASAYLAMGKYDSCSHTLQTSLNTITRLIQNQDQHYLDHIFEYYDILIFDHATQASLLHHRGQHVEAINILEQARSDVEKVYGAEGDKHIAYYEILNNLAAYYLEIDAYQKARPIVVEALDYHKRKGNVRQVNSLKNSLARIYYGEGNIDRSIDVWKEIHQELDTSDHQGGHTHLGVLNNLGSTYLDIEQYDSALLYMESGYRLLERFEIISPRIYKTTIYNLAEACRWKGQYQRAETYYRLLLDKIMMETLHEFTYLTEDEQRAFYKDQLFYIDSFRSFALEVSGLLPLQDSDSPYVSNQIAADLYNLQLVTKSIILNASRRMKEQILNGDDEALKTKYRQWVELKSEVAKLYKLELTDRQTLARLSNELTVLEAELTRLSAKFRKGFVSNVYQWQDVQAQLKSGECAVELVRVFDGLIYLALVITPDTKTSPAMSYVISRRSKHLEKQYLIQYQNAIKYQTKDTVSYTTFWEPISNTIKDNMPDGEMAKRIYISPDGVYNQINLNTLYDSKTEKYLIDETDIHLVSNTKELVNTTDQSEQKKTATLFGSPDFGSSRSEPEQFVPLPATAQEIGNISKQLSSNNWEATTYTGKQVNLMNIEKEHNTTILHIATHGFFQDSDDAHPMQSMLNSGIALTDANVSTSDGLLTAYEVAGHNLDDTNLVVLSACETGRGSYHTGEGVYGLQYAFQVAGADHLIMSLWKVDDEATQQLMTLFYQQYTDTGDVRSAFRDAQKKLRQTYPAPYYWGAFVLMGK